ncbi:hypothetical protein CSAL01_04135 [Colletotrichum salicis]|uniref:Uncharacterized protein n=1 Tax=Colletotrichum salicis TaxID=1209931 RepID=A0A135UUD9_9PEZI|nr:hypothetical protein CSAL01_04135 [Colletotrichum salicis]
MPCQSVCDSALLSLVETKSGKLVHPLDTLAWVYHGYGPVTSVGNARSDTDGLPLGFATETWVSVPVKLGFSKRSIAGRENMAWRCIMYQITSSLEAWGASQREAEQWARRRLGELSVLPVTSLMKEVQMGVLACFPSYDS